MFNIVAHIFHYVAVRHLMNQRDMKWDSHSKESVDGSFFWIELEQVG